MTTMAKGRASPRRRAIWLAAVTGIVAIMGAAVVIALVAGRKGEPAPAQDAHAGHRTAASAPAHPAERGVSGRTAVEIPPERQQAIGVRLATVTRETSAVPISAVATVAPDESRVSHVHTRVAGWIERLYVSTTGQRVRKGQPLAEIFSQELLATQNEYLALRQAMRRAGTGTVRNDLLESARARLRVFGMTDAEIDRLDEAGRARRTVTIVAPRSGIVLHRGIAVGTAVDPSTELLTVVDLSRVWIFAEVPENAVASVRVGTPAKITIPARGPRPIDARVAFVYPTLTEETRTVRVRFEVPNADGALRPGVYGTATFEGAPREVLVVPRDAVVDTGTAQHVFVAHDGHFVPRKVTAGARTAEGVEIVDGLAPGETIVASGVFLVDSESRLRASGVGAGHGGHGG